MTLLSKLVLVTGMTGAGKGTAAKGLEKVGYYVIDNLPRRPRSRPSRLASGPGTTTCGAAWSTYAPVRS